MKAAIILNGTFNTIIKQSKELSSYIYNFLSHEYDFEAWILSDDEIDFKQIHFCTLIKKIKFIKIDKKHLGEEYLNALTNMYQISCVDMLLFGSNLLSSELTVRLSYRLNGSSCLNVKNSYVDHENFIVEKMVYSNNMKASFILKNKPYCFSLAKGMNDNFKRTETLPPVAEYKFDSLLHQEYLKNFIVTTEEAKDDLKNAKIVVAIGKGIKKDEIDRFEELSTLIEGKIGASRPVVMNAWLPMDQLIGASGNVLAPDLCIAVAVSGAAAFSVGIEKSKYIIAINKDPSAPIFKIADVGICGDYKEIIDELIELLKIKK